MNKQVIKVENAPELPFSPAIRAGDYIFVSGQAGFQDPKSGEVIVGIEDQTRLCIENIKRVLNSAGSSLDDIVKVTIFLKNNFTRSRRTPSCKLYRYIQLGFSLGKRPADSCLSRCIIPVNFRIKSVP